MASKRISVYVKSGLKTAVTYYRFDQFLSKLDVEVTYRKMLPDDMYEKYMPISEKSLIVKGYILVYILVRVFAQLIKDSLRRPDVIIVSRRITYRVLPWLYKLLLNRLRRKGTIIVYDFDDEIVYAHEITRTNFDYMCRLSDAITVAGQPNKEMVLPEFYHKVVIMPTTDGDMYQLLTPDVERNRVASMGEAVRVVWVGTSVSIPFVRGICQHLETLGSKLLEQGRQLVVTVVCNRPLVYEPTSFALRNIVWQRDVAIREMLDAHVGIMPLAINTATKAKGGFKLVQYLSIGLPVVGTGIGINKEIIDPTVGFAIDSLDSSDWVTSILTVTQSADKWKEYSHAAYRKWLSSYSFEANLERWAEIIGSERVLPQTGGLDGCRLRIETKQHT